MDVFQFVDYLRQFNADVALIGAAAWGLDALLRHTLCKRLKGRAAQALPLLLGIALYAAYAAVTGAFAGAEAASVLAEGVACGSLATAIRAIASGGDAASARTACVKALLAPYGDIPDERAAALAQLVGSDEQGALSALADIAGEGMAPQLYAALEKALEGL